PSPRTTNFRAVRSARCGRRDAKTCGRRWQALIGEAHAAPHAACAPSTSRNDDAQRRRSRPMKIDDVRKRAYAMPLTNPAYPPGPYRFVNREFFIVTYRTSPEALRAVVPEPLEVAEPL